MGNQQKNRRSLRGKLAILVVFLLASTLSTTPAHGDDNPATEDLVMTCEVTSDFTDATYSQSGVQGVVPGETVTFTQAVHLDEGDVFQDILSRPDGSTYYASYLEHISLPSDLVLDPASVRLIVAPGGSANPLTAGTVQPTIPGSMPDPTDFVLETDTSTPGQTLHRVYFPGDEAQMLADQTGHGVLSYSVPEDGEIFVLTFEATLPSSSNVWGSVHDGAECFSSISTDESNRDTNRIQNAVATILPELAVQKDTPIDNAYAAGTEVEYTLTVSVPATDQATGQLTVAPARDVVLTDHVPVGLTPLDSAGAPVANGGTTAGGGTWDLANREVVYELGDMFPNTTPTVINEEMQIDVGVAPTVKLTNTIVGGVTYMPGTDPNDTTILDAGSDDATVIVASNGPTFEKSALRIPDSGLLADAIPLERYGTGLPYWYELEVTIPAGSQYENFTILDTLPDGVIFNSYVSADCTPAGATCPAPVPTLTPTVFPGGDTGIGWYPNQIVDDATNVRTFTLVYEVELDSNYFLGDDVIFFDEFVNDASVNWNTVDRLGAVDPSTAAPPTFDGSEGDTATVIYDRPILEIDKTVETSDGFTADESRTAWDYEVGDIATYTSVITNVGSSDAQNLTVTDTPVGVDIDVTTVLIDGVPCGGCSWTGGVLTVPVAGPIAAAGGTATISYEATPTQNGDVDNLIEIPAYEDPLGTPYDENPSDTVPLEIPDPKLSISKSEIPTAPATANTVGTLYPFEIKVTNTGSVTAYNPIVTDTPPTGICNVFPDGIIDPASPPDGGLANNGDVENTASGEYTILNPIAPGATVTFQIWLEVCDDIDVGEYSNTADLTWEDLNDNTDERGTVYGDSDTADLELVEAEFTVTKTPNVDAGATIPWSADSDENGTLDGDPSDPATADEYNSRIWTIAVKNTSEVPIGGLVIDDLMPDPFEYEYDTTTPNFTANWFGQQPSTITDNSNSGGGVIGPDFTRQLEFVIGQLEPGGEVELNITFWHNGESPSDGDLTRYNEVQVTNDNLTFHPVNHVADGEYTLIPVEIGPQVSKTVEATGTSPGIESIEGAPGQQFDFTIDVIVPSSEDVEIYDVWAFDTMPDGLSLVLPPDPGDIPNGVDNPGWNIVCAPDATYTGTCPSLADSDGSGNPGGQFLGIQSGSNGDTELAWWIGDQPVDATEAESRYRITFRVEVDTTFNDGSEVIDGVDEPFVNFVAPLFNRDPSLPGPTGNDETVPTTIPEVGDFDRIYPKDGAQIDIVTPRLEIVKNVYDEDGDPVTEITAGENYNYEVVVTNAGSGSAYHVTIEDDLASPAMANVLKWSNVSTTSGTVSCTTVSQGGPIAPPRTHDHLVCTEVGPLAPGASITITYDATTVDTDIFFAQFSSQNFDPMIIVNEVAAVEYWEADNAGAPAGNQYSTGEASARVFAYTPVAEIDAGCVSGLVEAPVGTDVEFWAVIGNGDRIDSAGNPDGDQTMTPYPREDNDGDGFPDAGVGHNPEVRIAVQDTFTYNGVSATGPGAGDPTYQTYSAFAAPDQILDGDVDNDGDGNIDQPGTYILVWDSLADIPHSPGHSTEGGYLPHSGAAVPTDGSFLPWIELLIDVTKTETGGGSIVADLELEDAAGNTDRGDLVNEYWEFSERDRAGCPGGQPSPRISKTPDDTDGVTVDPGELEWFTIHIQQHEDTPLAGTFTDHLPNGLIYAGDLPATDPNYAVAYMPVVPPGWGSLDAHLVSSTALSNGDTLLEWAPPPLPYGIAGDPLANNTDTRWEIRVPVVSEDDPPFPDEFVVNTFQWNPDGWGPRRDSGAMNTVGFGIPTISKRASTTSGLYGANFEFTIDVTIPANYSGHDLIVYDEINRWKNWDSPPHTFQDGGTYGVPDRIFPVVPNGNPRPAAPGNLANSPHFFYDPAEFEIHDYVSDDCYTSSCGAVGSPTDINAVPLPPAAFSEPLTIPLSQLNPEAVDSNGALGWYLGDITAHDTDRKIELVYEVEAPTIIDQMTRVAELRPGTFPFGIYSDASAATLHPEFTDPEAYWFQELSQVNHPNYVQLRSWRNPTGGDDVQGLWETASDDAWDDIGASNSWFDDAIASNGTARIAHEDDSVTVSYPLVQIDKDCHSIGDPAQKNPLYLNGSFNVECEITAENLSPVDAFDVKIEDVPLEDCRLGIDNGFGQDVARTYALSWTNGLRVVDPEDTSVVTYPCPITSVLTSPSSGTVTSGNNLPINAWELDIAAGRTETLTYQLAIDGWQDLRNHPIYDDHGVLEAQGKWINEAKLNPWSDTDGGDTIGGVTTVRDEVGFAESRISVTKFPYPQGYNPCIHRGPWIDWDGVDVAANDEWPWFAAEGASLYNPADHNHVNGAGYPYGQLGTFWNRDQGNTCADPLIPPEREISWGTLHPFNLRGLPLGTSYAGAPGWQTFGDPIDDNGSGFWLDHSLDDPTVWNDIFDADPTQPYRWAIDIRVDALQSLKNLEITDQLPYGWTYVPGSAEIIDGTWNLGDGPAFFAPDADVTVGYTQVPLPDPAQTTIGAGVCSNSPNYSRFGETLTWDFQRDGTGDGDWPWEYQYVDASTRQDHVSHEQGWSMVGNWVRIHFDAIPTNGTVAGVPSVFDCDPDTTSSEDFVMENNTTVTARPDRPLLNQAAQLTDSYDMLAPVPNPLAFEKTPDDDFVSDDTTAYFTISFTNDLNVPVTDLTINDTLTATPPPGGSGPLPGGGYTCGSATATANAVGFTEPTCTGGNSASTTLEWLIGSIAPGETIEITIPIVVPEDEQNQLVWDNTASTTVKEWYDSSFEDDGKITVLNPSPPPVVTKSSTPNPATINDVVTYDVSWEHDAQTVFFDLAYFDEVPDGLTFESHTGVTCTGGCPAGYTPGDVITMTPQVNADGTTTLMWWFGDMPGSPTASTWTMSYTVRVDDTYNDGTTQVLDEDVLTNTVTGYSNHENGMADPTGLVDPSAWDSSEFDPSEASHDLDIEEPELEIRKSATPSSSPVDSSSTIIFRVEVENTGGMDAFAVDISDLPNGALENIVMHPATYPGSVVTQGWTAVAPEVGWFIPVLDQGDTAIFEYTAEVTNDFLVEGFNQAENSATIESFRARGGIDPEDGDRIYEGDETSVAVTLAGPDMSIDKHAGDCASEFSPATVGQPLVWCMNITNDGDATAYNAVVQDTLPYEWTYDSNTTTGTNWTAIDPTVTTPFTGVERLEWLVGDIPAGETVQIQFTATPGAESPQNVTNWASVETFTSDGDPLPLSVGASASDPASAAIGTHYLEIAKTPNEQQWPLIPTGGTVDWTITITNPHPTTSNTDLVVTDFLPAPLTYNTSTFTDPGISIASVGAVGAGPGGTQQIEWNIDELLAGESVTIDITADVAGSGPDAVTQMQWYINDVEVESTEVIDPVVNQAKARFYEGASLGEFTWIDTNNDGLQDPTEPAVDGVTVNLLDGAGNPLYRDPATGVMSTDATLGWPAMTMVTGDDPSTSGVVEQGWYTFDGLPAGTYQVEFVPPAGFLPTKDHEGTDDAIDSDASRLTGLSHIINLTWGQHDPTIDAGYVDEDTYWEDIADIDIEKLTNGHQSDDPTGRVIAEGDQVIWTFIVENTGWVALANSEVTDSVVPDADIVCDIDGNGDFDDATNVIPLMLPDDIVTCQATGTAIDGPYTNDSNVSGTPVLPDPDTCGCDLDDPDSWPDEPTDYVDVENDDGPLGPETDDDPSHYFGSDPSVMVEKLTNDVQADTEPGPAIPVGDTVTWTYIVTNDGNMPLTDATVTDDQLDDSDIVCDVDGNGLFDDATNVIPLMLPDDEVTCQATGEAEIGQYENNATVTGTPVLPDPDTCGCDPLDPGDWPDDPEFYEPPVDDNGDPLPPVEDDDPSHYFGGNPSVMIEKLTNDVQADTEPGPAIPVGDTVTWTYIVTNDGNMPLTDATVTDDQLDDSDIVCDVDGNGLFDDATNVIPLMLPDDEVTCQATGEAEIGQYENNATVTGTPVLPDPDTCGCDPLDPGDWPDDPEFYEPPVDDNGDPLPPVEDDDPSHYFGSDGAIDIEKSTNGEDSDEAPGEIWAAGDTITWEYEVTNTSATALADVTVSDDQGVTVDCGDGTNVIAILIPGQSVTCTATGVATSGEYENLGSVTGTPVLPDPETCGCDIGDPSTWPTDPTLYEPALDDEGEPLGPVTDEDPSHYDGRDFDLEIDKSVVESSISSTQVEWLITVTNNGPDEAPGLIHVVDELESGLSFVSASGAGWTCTTAGQTVTCDHASALPAGEVTPDLYISTEILAPPGSTVTNGATVEVLYDFDDDGDGVTLGEGITENNTDSATATSPANASPNPEPGLLAFTGSNFLWLLAMAALLSITGFFLVRRSRDTRQPTPPSI